MPNKHVVLFLGAGFSKAINSSLPLGNDLLDPIEDHLRQQGKDSVVQIIRQLLPSPGVPSPPIQPFELLLGIFDHLRAQEAIGRPILLNEPADEIWCSIISALSAVVRFDHLGYDRYSETGTKLGDFIDVLQKYRNQLNFSFITTNYDLIADKTAQWLTDQKLGHIGCSSPPKDLRRFQYGIPIRGVWKGNGGAQPQFVDGYHPFSQQTGDIPVYKLHGSTNWSFCQACCALDLSQTRLEVVAVFQDGASTALCPVCGSRYRWIIVPPVPNKHISNDPALAPVWRAAEQALESATTVIFVGYALPSADPIVVQMLATTRLRSASRPNGPWSCYVVDPDLENIVKPRYNAVFGEINVKFKNVEFTHDLFSDLCQQINRAGP